MKFSIRYQILIYTIAPLLVFSIAISGIFLYNWSQNTQDAMDIRSNEIAAQAGNMAEFYLYTGDIGEISRIAEQILKFRDVQHIAFLDRKKNIIVKKSRDDLISQYENYEHTVISKNTLFSDFEGLNSVEDIEILGYVQLGISKDTVFVKQQKEILSLIAITLGMFLLIALFSHLFSRKLSQALDSLIKTTKKIERKQFYQRCEENGAGEMLQLQQTFNQMAESIEKNEIKQKQRIQEATAKLQDSVDELFEKNKELTSLREGTLQFERAKAITEERSRIMKDMHDGVGGQLVSAISILDQEPEETRSESTIEHLRATLNDLRLIILSLEESNKHLDTLLAGFKYHIQKQLNKLGIELIWNVDLLSTEEAIIQPNESLHILRILQEIFTNIIKHSGATEVTMSYENTEDFTAITIADNGNFLSFFDDAIKHGNGITNIKNRMAQIHSTVEFSQNKPSGLFVQLNLNLESKR